MKRRIAGAAIGLGLIAMGAGLGSGPVLSDTLSWADAQFAALTASVAANTTAITSNATAVATANTRTAGVVGGDGTQTLPAFTFPAETGTGMFRAGPGLLALTTSGTERMRLGPSYQNVPSGTRWGLAAATDTITANGLTVPNYGIAVGGSFAGGAGLHLSGYFGVAFYRGGAEVWRMAPDLLPSADNVFSVGSPTQRVRSVYASTVNLTGASAPTSSSDASGVVGDLRIVGSTLYWKTSTGWVRTVGATF